MKSRLLILAAAVGVALGWTGVAQAGYAVSPASGSTANSRADGELEVIFRTPSRNIYCDGWSLGRSLTDNTVMCAVMSTRIKVTYQCPDVGIGCPDVFTLNAQGRVDIARSSYHIGASRVLAYGQTLTLGHLRCVSRFTGLTCSSLASGHGFFLSRENLRTW